MPERNPILLKNGYYYIPIQKNASTAIKAHRKDHVRHVGKFGLIVIRDPFDRLISCWANRKQDFLRHSVHNWDEFIYYVCTTPDETLNAHARSQSYIYREGDTLIPFDRVNEEFAKRGIILHIHNKSVHDAVKFTEMQRKAVKRRYKDDFDVYSKALCNISDDSDGIS